MYVSSIEIQNFRCFGEGGQGFRMRLRPGLTALVGENDAGKTAVIDALRFALGTADQEWYRLDDTDFHEGEATREIRIVCKFEKLGPADKMAFVEYLTYGANAGDEPVLYVNWTARDTGKSLKGRPYPRVDVRSGKNGDGPIFAAEVRDLLRATYLRPLRDAEQALSAGRGSRLAQILRHSPLVKEGGSDNYDPEASISGQELSILGISKLLDHLLETQKGVSGTRDEVNKHLKSFSLRDDPLNSRIRASGTTASDEVRRRELLEKLDLTLEDKGKPGFGSNNLLFMACELLLLGQDDEGNKMLLIEEPEAHLHPQRQLRAMRYLQDQASKTDIQIIITTHSPNLASAISLSNLVMIHRGRAFSMAEGDTKLSPSDYRFLERFLDVTKANLFFARGVMIVEGDAENILLPTLAKILGRDFTGHGVSIVNVGGVGLRRYARIFKRADEESNGTLEVPVACLTDMDVMPDCAPTIIGKVKNEEEWPAGRRWKAGKDFAPEELAARRKALEDKASGQRVKTFVSDEWTLEYDLALGQRDEDGAFNGGLAEDVFVAACLADKDDAINVAATQYQRIRAAVKVGETALWEFNELREHAAEKDGSSPDEVLASRVYARLVKDGISKPVAAQYLAGRLERKWQKGTLTPSDLRAQLPRYIVNAIDYVTGQEPAPAPPAVESPNE
jgi:putative ATP-dependent endonuclease of OLD family